jgi:hypothetical protein
MSLGEEGGRDSRPFPDPERSLAPRKPRTVGGIVYLAVLTATVVGLALIVLNHWRFGLATIGVALLCGAVGRLVIPRDNAGMLGMRPRAVDVLILTGLGAGLVILSAVIPERPLL